MTPNCNRTTMPNTQFARRILTALLTVMLFGPAAWAQTESSSASSPKSAPAWGPTSVETFHLSYKTQQNDATEVLNAVRNVLDPHTRVQLVYASNAIVVETTAEQMAIARRLIEELDRPRKAYRLTYTVTDMDGDRRVGTRHFSMVAIPEQKTQLKQVNKVPVMTGAYKRESNDTQEQITYLDVGMMFEATVNEFGNGVNLRSKVEQSSVTEEKSGVGPQDPIVRFSSVEGSSFLTFGKPLILGSIDVPETTRRLDISVMAEPIQ